MKTISILSLAAVLGIGLFTIGCETSHTETDTPALMGGTNHDETTTTHNPITNTDDKTSVSTHTP